MPSIRIPERRPKLLFVFADDSFFWSHSLPVARAALLAGYDVIAATGGDSYARQIQDEGFRLIPLKLIRSSRSPLQELSAIRQLRQVYRLEHPEIVHNVAIKPVLYGSMARLGLNGMSTLNEFAGLGYLVASSSRKATFLRWLVWRALRFFLNRSNQQVLVANQHDKQILTQRLGVDSERILFTRGAGVDVHLFHPTPEPAGMPLVVFASRMLWIKGVQEFVEAARRLRARGIAARFVLVGDADENNPSSVSRRELSEWQEEGTVEWWGQRRDMPHVFQQSSLVCLPSHGGEGIPKVLMEAGASGRAVVTTDVPGCRDIVRQGINGTVVQPRNVMALFEAIEKLLKDPVLRYKMGQHGRKIAVSEFSEEAVVEQTLAFYRELLSPRTACLVQAQQSEASLR